MERIKEEIEKLIKALVESLRGGNHRRKLVYARVYETRRNS